MIAKQSLRQLYESVGSPAGFARKMYHWLGLTDARGNPYRDEFGRPQVKDPTNAQGQPYPRLSPREVSFKDLAESVIGEDWHRRLNPDTARRVMLMEEERPLVEAGTNAVPPSSFADINAFTAVVTGLLEISIMDGWQNPQFIADQLMPPDSTRMFAGRKVIGTTRLGDVAEVRLPGMPTKRAGFGERWITQPATVENALSVEVTQEAVYLDLTGEVLEQANGVGEWLGWRKEIRCIDAWVGNVNTYSYKGTSYNTYIANGYFNNDLSSNELVDFTNVETVLIAFREMQDPETGLRVLITPNRILVMQGKLMTARMIFGKGDVEVRSQGGLYPSVTGSAGPTSNFLPASVRRAPNPIAGLFGEPLTSPLVYQRLTDSAANGGAALSASTAERYWWVWDSTKPPMKYAQNWPLRVQTAAPNQLDMIDRGIVHFVKADERGTPMVYEPRRVVRSKP